MTQAALSFRRAPPCSYLALSVIPWRPRCNILAAAQLGSALLLSDLIQNLLVPVSFSCALSTHPPPSLSLSLSLSVCVFACALSVFISRRVHRTFVSASALVRLRQRGAHPHRQHCASRELS